MLIDREKIISLISKQTDFDQRIALNDILVGFILTCYCSNSFINDALTRRSSGPVGRSFFCQFWES
jgi:hypothetical protein